MVRGTLRWLAHAKHISALTLVWFVRYEPRILLRALSTGEPHPLAAPSAGTAGAIELAESKLQPTMDGDTTSIRGSYLGTVVHGGALDELVIWNWTTGAREWGMPLDKGVGQWCFLDDAHILFPKNVFAGSPVLRARQRRLHVRRFLRAQQDDDDDDAPERVFVLPEPRYPLGSSMGARLLSRPTPDPSASLSAFAAGELFHPSAEDHLLTVELWAYYASGWEVSDLHIPTRVLLSPPPAAAPPSASGPGQQQRIIPWNAWRHAITQSPPLEHPRDMAPLGPLAHGMRRLSWSCGTNSRVRAAAAAVRSTSPISPISTYSTSTSSSSRRKTVSVWDLHPGRTEQAMAAAAAAHQSHDGSGGGGAAVIQFACSCGGGAGATGVGEGGEGRSRVTAAPPPSASEPQQRGQWPYVLSEVSLPREIQEADPIGIKFAMCGDALVVLEVSRPHAFFDNSSHYFLTAVRPLARRPRNEQATCSYVLITFQP